ncbi:MAG: pseudouridylate synthase [Gammaproteobacteria bacterium]|nr:pseudouridylate synthase [Gammaproteobacteria bacterium]
MNLPILYRDEHYVAIDKPSGLLVHKTELARAEAYALQLLRRQLRRRVYPVHRLDRPTSGVLLFGLSAAAAREACGLFETHVVSKRYLAVVRGYAPDSGHIDYPLCEEDDGRPAQEARTDYRCLARAELPIAIGRYATSRYSLVEVMPLTGRKHQIRKHFHHIFHPLIGDTTYGEGRHNRLFRQEFEASRLLLIAHELAFVQPFSGEAVRIRAGLDEEWRRVLAGLGWEGAQTQLAGDQSAASRG